MLRKFIAFSLLIVIAITSCTQEEEVDYGPIDQKIIEDYIAEHEITGAQSTASGLYYVIQKPGGANHPNIKSSVSANFKGYLTDSTIFDTSYPTGQPMTRPLNTLIAGWKEGLPLIGVGGKILLFIPSELGYGSTPQTKTISGALTIIVPANSVLIFDIELVDFY